MTSLERQLAVSPPIFEGGILQTFDIVCKLRAPCQTHQRHCCY